MYSECVMLNTPHKYHSSENILSNLVAIAQSFEFLLILDF